MASVPSISYSITVRLDVPARGNAVSQLTHAVEEAGGIVTALDVTASGHERLQHRRDLRRQRHRARRSS